MAGSSSDNDGVITEINVTPLVDIMLVLLIIFMLTAHVIDKQAIEMKLPKAATGEAAPAAVLGLSIDRLGALYLNGVPIDEAALTLAMQQAARKDTEAQALIAADESVPHGRVVHLIDMARQAGVHQFSLNVDPALTAP